MPYLHVVFWRPSRIFQILTTQWIGIGRTGGNSAIGLLGTAAPGIFRGSFKLLDVCLVFLLVLAFADNLYRAEVFRFDFTWIADFLLVRIGLLGFVYGLIAFKSHLNS